MEKNAINEALVAKALEQYGLTEDDIFALPWEDDKKADFGAKAKAYLGDTSEEPWEYKGRNVLLIAKAPPSTLVDDYRSTLKANSRFVMIEAPMFGENEDGSTKRAASVSFEVDHADGTTTHHSVAVPTKYAKKYGGYVGDPTDPNNMIGCMKVTKVPALTAKAVQQGKKVYPEGFVIELNEEWKRADGGRLYSLNTWQNSENGALRGRALKAEMKVNNQDLLEETLANEAIAEIMGDKGRMKAAVQARIKAKLAEKQIVVDESLITSKVSDAVA